MPIKAKARRATAALMFLGSPLSCGAQMAKATLDSYLSKSVAEAESLDSATIKEWTTRHPGEVVEDPVDKGSDYDPANASKLNPRQQQDMKLEGRWCLRSLAEIDLAGKIHVRRVALFYQPLVEQIYGKPLPPLPKEIGDTLRNHGCRLVKILHEFRGVPDPQNFVGTIVKQMPGKRLEEPADLSSLPEMPTGSLSARLRNSATQFPTIIYSFAIRRSSTPRISPLSFWSGKGEL